MCQALLEVMKPEIDRIREEEKRDGIEIGERRGEKRGIELGERRGEKRGEKRGKIIGLIEAFRELDKGDEEIKQVLMQKYEMTEEEALSYLPDNV